MSSPPRVAVLDADERCPRLPLVVGAGEAYAVVWPGVGADDALDAPHLAAARQRHRSACAIRWRRSTT